MDEFKVSVKNRTPDKGLEPLTLRLRRDTTLFHFSKLFLIQNYRFLYHGDQKISWWTSMQVAGNELRNPPVKFRQER